MTFMVFMFSQRFGMDAKLGISDAYYFNKLYDRERMLMLTTYNEYHKIDLTDHLDTLHDGFVICKLII